MKKNPPILMSIAGSDSSAGAGVQADLKTCAAHNVYGTNVITSITAQNSFEVTALHPLPPEIVRAQFDAILDDVAIDAIKIGLLGSHEIVEVLALALSGLGETKPLVVLDPVLGSTTGTPFLCADGIAALKTRLLPFCDVVSPNIKEAETLLGISIQTRSDMEKAATAMIKAGMGRAVVLTGGDSIDDTCADLLHDGSTFRWFEGEKIKTQNSHGTGCTFSTSLACHMAKGNSLIEAVEKAKTFTSDCLRAASMTALGKGSGPLLHGLIK